MKRSLAILLVSVLFSCKRPDQAESRFFISNISTGKFDRELFIVKVDQEEVFEDTLRKKLEYTYTWQEKSVSIPKDSFQLSVSVSGENFKIRKDTFLHFQDSIFIRFNFLPYHKRYNHPEIFKHINGTTSRLTEIADSLYAADALSNAEDYLNDSIPEKRNIEIFSR